MAPHPSYVFLSPYEFHARDPATLVELRMRNLSNLIRQKPRWWEKVNDDALVAKWRAEMVEFDRLASGQEWRDEGDDVSRPLSLGERPRPRVAFDDQTRNKRWPSDPITDTQLDYVFAELKWAASRVEPTTGIHVRGFVVSVVNVC